MRSPKTATPTRPRPAGRSVAGVILGVALWLVGAAHAWVADWPDAETIEKFLASARVVKREQIGVGVTRSVRVTLRHGHRTARAIWKTVDEQVPFQRFDDGTFEIGFTDSYRYEIAAYELDKLLGVGLVPPVVPRRLGRDRGALQLWIEGTTMELDRSQRGTPIKDVKRWSRQIYTVRLFHRLTYNTDFNNASNVLSDADERIYLIDHSRAFRTTKKLIAEEDLQRFSKPLLEALRALDRQTLTDTLGRWLSRAQIDGLLARRDLIVARSDRLIVERGADAVLYR